VLAERIEFAEGFFPETSRASGYRDAGRAAGIGFVNLFKLLIIK
jgi:hypothetical protein